MFVYQSDPSKLNIIHLVVGNESCDLDSAVAALVTAFIHFVSIFFTLWYDSHLNIHVCLKTL